MENRFLLQSYENIGIRLDRLDPSHVVGVTQVSLDEFSREKNPRLQGCTT